METKLSVINDELEALTNATAIASTSGDDRSVEQIISKFITGSDTRTEEIMSECSVRAQQIKEKINEILETRESLVTDDDSQQTGAHISNDSIINLQKELENEIKDLSGVQKVASNSDDIKTNVAIVNSDNTAKQSNLNIGVSSDAKVSDNSKQNSNESNESVCQQNNANDNNNAKPTNANNGNNNLNRKQTKSVLKKSEHKEKVSTEQLNKKLTNLSSDAERIAYLSNCYLELIEENKLVSHHSKQSDRLNHQLTKEKNQMQSEHNKVVLAKSRLESLCRELQRQNKIIKEESLIKIKEEEEKRREIANKFQGTLNEIMQLIQENQRRNSQLKEENADLAQKLKTLMGHYENWEKHTEQIIKQKDLETQLVKAKYAKTNLILNQEKDLFLKEKQQLITMVSDLQKRCSDLTATELQLRTELSVYTTKYEEFQGVLTKSNDMFAGFKRDMEKMSKQIKKLEKETALWRSKWENSNKALISLTEEKQRRETELLASLQKIGTLEKLCRALQEERLQMQNQLKQTETNTTDTDVSNDAQPLQFKQTETNITNTDGSNDAQPLYQ